MSISIVNYSKNGRNAVLSEFTLTKKKVEESFLPQIPRSVSKKVIRSKQPSFTNEILRQNIKRSFKKPVELRVNRLKIHFDANQKPKRVFSAVKARISESKKKRLLSKEKRTFKDKIILKTSIY